MKRGLLIQTAVLALVALLAGSAQADDHEKGLKVGQVAPDFTLTDFDGNAHTLSALKGQPVVLVFTSQECPWVRGADPDISAVARKYADKGVTFIGIDSHASTTPDEIKAYAAEKNLAYPVVKDEKNVYADKVGATRTPEIFVLDADQTVVYHGAFDNRKVPEETGDTNYLDAALSSVTSADEVATKHVAAWGCTIKRAPKEKAAAEHVHGPGDGHDHDARLANPAPVVSAAVVPAADGETAEKPKKAEKADKAEGCEKADTCCPAKKKEAVSATPSAFLTPYDAPAVSAAVVPAADGETAEKPKKAEKADKAEGCEKADTCCPAKKKEAVSATPSAFLTPYDAPAVSAAVVPAADGETAEKPKKAEKAEKADKAEGCEKADTCCPAKKKEAVSATPSAFLTPHDAPAVSAAVVPAADGETSEKPKKAEKADKAEGCEKADTCCPAKKKEAVSATPSAFLTPHDAPAVSAAVVPAADGETSEKPKKAEKAEKAEGCEKADTCCPAKKKEAVSATPSAFLTPYDAPAVSAAVVPAADGETAEKSEKTEGCDAAKKGCSSKSKSCPAGGSAKGTVS